ncbi:MAG: insulinase family protein [Flavobacteriales bacterium]|nr:insulinase family protein [Flavobacteriales bacterium]
MKKYISLFTAAAILMLAACSPKKLDRSHAPAAGPAPKLQIGQYQLVQLDNGMKLIVVENHKLPRVTYSIGLDIDPILEGQKAGYVQMAGDLLSAGTTSKSKAQIDEAVDYIGASMSTSANGMYGDCLKKHTDEFLSIFSDVLLHPSYPQDEIEKNRKQSLSALTSEKTDPDALSNKIGGLMKYGVSHPYGEIKTEESINNINRDDLVGFYNTYFKPNIAYLVVVGDITFDEAKAQADKYFGGWKKGDVKPLTYAKPTLPASNRVIFVPLAGAVQSSIDVTYPLDIQPGTPEALKARVLNNILGGSGFQTRLNQNLREDKAYTYGAYSQIVDDEVIGYFSAGASVRNAVTDSAVTEILYEMKKLTTDLVPDSTLKTIKNIMTGNFARSLERPQTIANFALNIEKYKLPKDYYETYLQRLNAVTAEEIREFAKKVIKPENAYITIVGNKEIASNLDKFAAGGKTELMNADGTPFSDMKPVPAGVTTESVFKKFIDARGGEKNLASIKSFEQSGTMTMSGMPLSMTVKMKSPDKFKMSLSMGPQELMKQVVNGKSGLNIQMGQKSPMDASTLADVQLESDQLAVMHLDQYGMKATIKGIDMVNKEECYVVELTKPDGTTNTEYYSINTGLKLKSISVGNEADGGMLVESVYEDYKDFNGIKFPMKMTQIVGAEQIVITLTDVKINASIDDKEFTLE